MCNGGACDKCGAGSWNYQAPHCEHDVVERHEYGGGAAFGARDPGPKEEA